jgi:hypothetical protein
VDNLDGFDSVISKALKAKLRLLEGETQSMAEF